MSPTERIPVRIFAGAEEACKAVARRIAEVIRTRSAEGRPAVLGLATGNSPVNVYKELVRMHRHEGLDLAGVVTFNLDEYWPIDPKAVQSFRTWMRENFFRHVNVPAANVHGLSSDVPPGQVEAHCRRYERAIASAGGIDLQLLGIGRSGHIGFNEPHSPRDSRTRLVHLDRMTRRSAASDFFGEENVPETALTVGVGTILEAREIALLAFGEHKAEIVRRAVEQAASAEVAASFLQQHARAVCYLDEAAAGGLTRMATPWLTGPCRWDDLLTRQAAIWLAGRLQKPVLKLTDEDYVENALAELRAAGGGAERINLAVFRHLMNTITGHPAGRERPRRIIVFSPHPDDDVISMGGSIMRLVADGHEVHVAYMVSGFLSVFDHDVARYADFVRSFNKIFGLTPAASGRIRRHVDGYLLRKRPGDVDTPEVQAIKGLIRRTEAVDAARFCGIPADRVHFLDLPFYNTGKVQKLEIGPKDVRRVRRLLERVRPEVVFAAGDLSDPHGTHRLCQQAGLEALDQYVAAGGTQPLLWYYRGAWQEWGPEQIDMAVPLSPQEARRKRFAIFRHQSQKDRAMFPGPYDSREFWQRAEERNRNTAAIYDRLGLPEYTALEAFVRHPLRRSAHAAAQLTALD